MQCGDPGLAGKEWHFLKVAHGDKEADSQVLWNCRKASDRVLKLERVGEFYHINPQSNTNLPK